jgi:hypothetical protein
MNVRDDDPTALTVKSDMALRDLTPILPRKWRTNVPPKRCCLSTKPCNKVYGSQSSGSIKAKECLAFFSTLCDSLAVISLNSVNLIMFIILSHSMIDSRLFFGLDLLTTLTFDS